MTEPRQIPSKIVHGVLIKVLGQGVLLLGPSGVGKSELALELIDRGGQLVADDAVELRREGNGLIGKAPDLTRGKMFIRGLGLFDLTRTHGKRSVADRSLVRLCIELGHFDDRGDALAPHDDYYCQLGVELPLIKLSALPRLPSPVIIEAAVRIQDDAEHCTLASQLLANHDAILSQHLSVTESRDQ
mgnify:CR=1 FL=1